MSNAEAVTHPMLWCASLLLALLASVDLALDASNRAVEVAKQRLGNCHSSVMVERYAHLAPNHLARAAARLGSLLGGYGLATLEKEERSAWRANPL